MEIKSLENTCFGTLFEAFGQAFADYEVQLDETQLRRMLRRRGFDPRLSFATFDGERIAAFTLNGTGNFNGLPTAYDTGTGTLEAYRGQGLAAKVFEHSIPYLREPESGNTCWKSCNTTRRRCPFTGSSGSGRPASSIMPYNRTLRFASRPKARISTVRSCQSVRDGSNPILSSGISRPPGRTAPRPSGGQPGTSSG